MRIPIILICIAILTGCGYESESAKKAQFKMDALLYVPDMVAPGIISREHFEGHASITPDGNEIYYAVYINDHTYSTIVFSTKKVNKWSEPKIVSFSGNYSDGSPALSPDGKRLYFSSKRPTPYQEAKRDNDIWYVQRTKNRWSEPIWLEEINTEYNEFSPSIDREGNLFFCSNRPNGCGDMDVYLSKSNKETFDTPKLLDESINSIYHEGNVGVSPDGKLLFVMIQHKPGDFGFDDIYYSKKKVVNGLM